MKLRPELEAITAPPRILRLLRHRGYPVPWFVAWVKGVPDFRIIDTPKLRRAIDQSLCWVCGGPMIGRRAYLVGPMCAVNRVSAEPPSHVPCALYSAQACPFLTRPHAKRREIAIETDLPAGEMIRRNPGVALVWVVGALTIVREMDHGLGYLFDLGIPLATHWFAEGRLATPEEVRASIDSGLPILRESAESEGAEAVAELERMTELAMQYLPA